jgi:CRP-like cAMP-binding protein
VLTDGEVEVNVSGELRRMMRRGDFFGEISMDKRVLATASIVAKTPVQALVMSHEQFRSLSAAAPALSRLQTAIGDRLARDRMVADDRQARK